jgi:hypothetical protein
LHTLKIERVLFATLQIVHVKSTDDLLPLDHIAGVDRSLQLARFQVNQRYLLGIRTTDTPRKTRRRANQADGFHHEVATIEPVSSVIRHGELSSSFCTRVSPLSRRENCSDQQFWTYAVNVSGELWLAKSQANPLSLAPLMRNPDFTHHPISDKRFDAKRIENARNLSVNACL